MRRSGPVRKTAHRSPKWGRCSLPGSCWATTAATPAGWPTAACDIPSPAPVGAAVPQRLPWGSMASLTKSTSSTECTASRAKTEPQAHTDTVQTRTHTHTHIHTRVQGGIVDGLMHLNCDALFYENLITLCCCFVTWDRIILRGIVYTYLRFILFNQCLWSFKKKNGLRRGAENGFPV